MLLISGQRMRGDPMGTMRLRKPREHGRLKVTSLLLGVECATVAAAVVTMPLYPTRSAMSSSSIPSELSSETNVCRNSRGTQSVPRPASSVILLNSGSTL